MIIEIAHAVKEAGAHALRGGSFKPRTSPYSFQGHGEKALKWMAEAREATGLPVVTEAMDVEQIELVTHYADVIQIGARNMQNYSLCMPLAPASTLFFSTRHVVNGRRAAHGR